MAFDVESLRKLSPNTILRSIYTLIIIIIIRIDVYITKVNLLVKMYLYKGRDEAVR